MSRIVDADLLRVELDPRQLEAAVHLDGPQLILAGAGSGKTRALTHKIAHLISARGVDPARILAVTFTNKAAKEMMERLRKLLDAPNLRLEWMGTFHSICARLLRRSFSANGGAVPRSLGWPYTGDFTIYDENDIRRVVSDVMKVGDLTPDASDIRKATYRIGSWKNQGVDPEQARVRADNMLEEHLAEIYAGYQERLRSLNALDFDDLLLLSVQVLERVPQIRDQFRYRLQYSFVDEYQDTNPVQYQLLRLLVAEPANNVTVVGDDDQSIYGWRGADVGIIRNFQKDFPGAHVVKLERNYRSTSNIVKGAGSVIRNNLRQGDMAKDVYSEREPGEPIRHAQVFDDRAEARRIASRIQDSGRDSWASTAVFYRTNAQSRLLEEQLIYAGVPYVIYGGTRFFERREIKDLLAYLRVIANPTDEENLRRVLTTPRRGIGDASIDKLFTWARANALPAVHALQHAPSIVSGKAVQGMVKTGALIGEWGEVLSAGVPLPSLLDRIVGQTGFRKWLEEDEPETADDRLRNLDQLVSALVEWDQEHNEGTLADFLQEVSLLTDQDRSAEAMEAVRLMTVHAAKGLEFDAVHIAGCDDSLFPLTPRGNLQGDEIRRHMEEERRLFYVGCTRARQRLYLYSAQNRRIHGRDTLFTPSPFLSEIDSAVLEVEGEDNLPSWARSLAASDDGAATMPHRTSRPFHSSAASYSGGGQRGGQPWKNGGWKDRSTNRPAPAKVTRPVTPVVERIERGPRYEVDEFSQDEVYLRPGSKVRHSKFGSGRVLSCDGTGDAARVRVQFTDGSVRSLIAKYANLVVER